VYPLAKKEIKYVLRDQARVFPFLFNGYIFEGFEGFDERFGGK
jgi:hypothetical protein